MVLERPYVSSTNYYFYETFDDPAREALVLIMGYGGSARVWPPSFLTQLASRYRVITLDNRGTGLSPKPRDVRDYSIGKMAEDLESGLKVLAKDGAHILGYSLGGCIAQEYTHRYPQKVKSLTLMSSTCGGALYTRPGPGILEGLGNPTGFTLWDLYLSTWRYCFSAEGIQKYEPVLKELFERSRGHLTPLMSLLGQMKAYLAFDGTAYLKEFSMPVKIITGANDRLCLAINSRRLHEAVPHSSLLECAGVEHAPHVEEEKRVLEFLGV